MYKELGNVLGLLSVVVGFLNDQFQR